MVMTGSASSFAEEDVSMYMTEATTEAPSTEAIQEEPAPEETYEEPVQPEIPSAEELPQPEIPAPQTEAAPAGTEAASEAEEADTETPASENETNEASQTEEQSEAQESESETEHEPIYTLINDNGPYRVEVSRKNGKQFEEGTQLMFLSTYELAVADFEEGFSGQEEIARRAEEYDAIFLDCAVDTAWSRAKDENSLGEEHEGAFKEQLKQAYDSFAPMYAVLEDKDGNVLSSDGIDYTFYYKDNHTYSGVIDGTLSAAPTVFSVKEENGETYLYGKEVKDGFWTYGYADEDESAYIEIDSPEGDYVSIAFMDADFMYMPEGVMEGAVIDDGSENSQNETETEEEKRYPVNIVEGEGYEIEILDPKDTYLPGEEISYVVRSTKEDTIITGSYAANNEDFAKDIADANMSSDDEFLPDEDAVEEQVQEVYDEYSSMDNASLLGTGYLDIKTDEKSSSLLDAAETEKDSGIETQEDTEEDEEDSITEYEVEDVSDVSGNIEELRALYEKIEEEDVEDIGSDELPVSPIVSYEEYLEEEATDSEDEDAVASEGGAYSSEDLMSTPILEEVDAAFNDLQAKEQTFKVIMPSSPMTISVSTAQKAWNGYGNLWTGLKHCGEGSTHFKLYRNQTSGDYVPLYFIPGVTTSKVIGTGNSALLTKTAEGRALFLPTGKGISGFGVRYSKVGYDYKAHKWLDLELVCTGYGSYTHKWTTTKNGKSYSHSMETFPMIAIHMNKIGVNFVHGYKSDYKITVYENGTNIRHATNYRFRLKDIDYTQRYTFKPNTSNLDTYAYSNSIVYYDVDNGTYKLHATEDGSESYDESNVVFDTKGSSVFNLGIKRPANKEANDAPNGKAKYEIYKYCKKNFYSTLTDPSHWKQDLGPNELNPGINLIEWDSFPLNVVSPPEPVKSVGKTLKAVNKTEETLDYDQDEYFYQIEQLVPVEKSGYTFNLFKLSDELPVGVTFVKLESAVCVDNGANVVANGTWTFSGSGRNISADFKGKGNAAMYGRTYRFVFRVKLDRDAIKPFSKTEDSYTYMVKNTARLEYNISNSGNKSVNSNTVKTYAPTLVKRPTITKSVELGGDYTKNNWANSAVSDNGIDDGFMFRLSVEAPKNSNYSRLKSLMIEDVLPNGADYDSSNTRGIVIIKDDVNVTNQFTIGLPSEDLQPETFSAKLIDSYLNDYNGTHFDIYIPCKWNREELQSEGLINQEEQIKNYGPIYNGPGDDPVGTKCHVVAENGSGDTTWKTDRDSNQVSVRAFRQLTTDPGEPVPGNLTPVVEKEIQDNSSWALETTTPTPDDTFTYKLIANMDGTSIPSSMPEITITRDMVTGGQLCDQNGIKISLTGEEVSVPEYVTYNGSVYRVTGIGANAFKDLTGIGSINLPDCVTSIGESAFEGCTGLTAVYLPAALTSIGAKALKGCSSLITNLYIPRGVSSIPAEAFAGTKDIVIAFAEGASSIGAKAFSGTTNVEVRIPTTMASIANDAFEKSSEDSIVFFDEEASVSGAAAIGAVSDSENLSPSVTLHAVQSEEISLQYNYVAFKDTLPEGADMLPGTLHIENESGTDLTDSFYVNVEGKELTINALSPLDLRDAHLIVTFDCRWNEEECRENGYVKFNASDRSYQYARIKNSFKLNYSFNPYTEDDGYLSTYKTSNNVYVSTKEEKPEAEGSNKRIIYEGDELLQHTLADENETVVFRVGQPVQHLHNWWVSNLTFEDQILDVLKINNVSIIFHDNYDGSERTDATWSGSAISDAWTNRGDWSMRCVNNLINIKTTSSEPFNYDSNGVYYMQVTCNIADAQHNFEGTFEWHGQERSYYSIDANGALKITIPNEASTTISFANADETDPDDYEFDTNEVEIDFTRKAAKVLLEKKNDFDAFVDNAGFTVYEWNNDTNRYMSFANMEYDSTLKKYVLPENVYLYADEKNENKFMIVETSVPYGYSETKAFKTTFTIPDDANKAVQNISIEGENEVASTIVNVLKYEEQTEDQILAEEPKVPLDGAVFEFFAAEDIYTPEGSEKGILIYHKDEKIGEAVSDENGLATSNEKYYPGEYYFKEKTAPTGYELNDSEHHFTVDYTPTTCVVSYDDSDDAGEDASKKYIIKAREVSASKTLLLDLNETEQVSYNFEVANNDGSNTTKNGMAYTIRVVYNDDAGSDDNGEGVGNHTIYEEESDMMHAAQICSALNVQIDGADGLEDPTGYGWTFRNSEWNFVRGGEEQSRAHTLTFTGDPKVIDVDFIREHISIYVSATIISDPAEVYDPPIETYEVPSVQKYVHDGSSYIQGTAQTSPNEDVLFSLASTFPVNEGTEHELDDVVIKDVLPKGLRFKSFSSGTQAGTSDLPGAFTVQNTNDSLVFTATNPSSLEGQTVYINLVCEWDMEELSEEGLISIKNSRYLYGPVKNNFALTVEYSGDGVEKPKKNRFSNDVYVKAVGDEVPTMQAPEKYIVDGSSLVDNKVLTNRDEEFTYRIFQKIPSYPASVWPASIEISDDIVSGLKPESFKILTLTGAPSSSGGSTVAGPFGAEEESTYENWTYKKDSNTYSFRITDTDAVKALYGKTVVIEVKGHINNNESVLNSEYQFRINENTTENRTYYKEGPRGYYLEFPNIAKTSASFSSEPGMDAPEDTTLYTGEVDLVVEEKNATVELKKLERIAGDTEASRKAVSNAEFTVYKWSEAAGEYIEAASLVYDEDTQTYKLPANTRLCEDTDNMNRFKIVETVVPDKYVPMEDIEFSIEPEAGKLTQEISLKGNNDLVNTNLEILKRDSDDTVNIEGVTFEIHSVDKISSPAGKVLYQRGGLVETVTTNASGIANVTKPLYPGRYYIKETDAPAEYDFDPEKMYSFEVVYNGESREAHVRFYNDKLKEDERDHATIYDPKHYDFNTPELSKWVSSAYDANTPASGWVISAETDSLEDTFCYMLRTKVPENTAQYALTSFSIKDTLPEGADMSSIKVRYKLTGSSDPDVTNEFTITSAGDDIVITANDPADLEGKTVYVIVTCTWDKDELLNAAIPMITYKNGIYYAGPIENRYSVSTGYASGDNWKNTSGDVYVTTKDPTERPQVTPPAKEVRNLEDSWDSTVTYMGTQEDAVFRISQDIPVCEGFWGIDSLEIKDEFLSALTAKSAVLYLGEDEVASWGTLSSTAAESNGWQAEYRNNTLTVTGKPDGTYYGKTLNLVVTTDIADDDTLDGTYFWDGERVPYRTGSGKTEKATIPNKAETTFNYYPDKYGDSPTPDTQETPPVEVNILTPHETYNIVKAMQNDNWEGIHDGDVLRFKAEQYVNGTWVALSGLYYNDGSTEKQTGSDGILELTCVSKSVSGSITDYYDKGIHTGAYYDTLQEIEDGSIRILETYGNSVFGDLVLESEDTQTNTLTFTNEPEMVPVQIEKRSSNDTDKGFVFTVHEIVNTIINGSEGTTERPAAGLRYKLFDSETGELVEEGVTNGSGQLTIYGGTYASFTAAKGTQWKATESYSYPYSLSACEVAEETIENQS